MNKRTQSGVSIVAAVFLVVVIALIATFLVGIGTVSRTQSAHAVVETRARYAAASGLEWALQRVLANPLAPGCGDFPAAFTISGGGSGGFRVAVDCVEQTVTEGAQTYGVFDLEVVAERGTVGQEDYFRRSLTAAVTSAP